MDIIMANKTKEMIIKSFLSIAERDDVASDKISITDVVEECKISRQTFYYHFKDLDQMLKWAFENEINLIEKNINKYNNWADTILLFEGFLNKYKIYLKKCLDTKQFIFVYSLLNNELHRFTQDFITPKLKHYDEKADFAVTVYVYSLLGFIIKELKKDEPDFSTMVLELSKQFNNSSK